MNSCRLEQLRYVGETERSRTLTKCALLQVNPNGEIRYLVIIKPVFTPFISRKDSRTRRQPCRQEAHQHLGGKFVLSVLFSSITLLNTPYSLQSASILLYLANTYDKEFKFHFKDADEQAEMMNWIFFIQGGAGPMMGQVSSSPLIL